MSFSPPLLDIINERIDTFREQLERFIRSALLRLTMTLPQM